LNSVMVPGEVFKRGLTTERDKRKKVDFYIWLDKKEEKKKGGKERDFSTSEESFTDGKGEERVSFTIPA